MNPIGDAMNWIQAVLLGTIATSIAVIAVASVGFMMFTGRIDWRRAVQVVIGCFIVFGASTVASGIQALAGGAGPPPVIPAPSVQTAPPSNAPPLDPYAGAAVP
ncbi:MAG: TrbC/VirB2 family protein [Sphingomicrobium sp.]